MAICGSGRPLRSGALQPPALPAPGAQLLPGPSVSFRRPGEAISRGLGHGTGFPWNAALGPIQVQFDCGHWCVKIISRMTSAKCWIPGALAKPNGCSMTEAAWAAWARLRVTPRISIVGHALMLLCVSPCCHRLLAAVTVEPRCRRFIFSGV